VSPDHRWRPGGGCGSRCGLLTLRIDPNLGGRAATMYAGAERGPWWAALTIWGVVNAVCLLQAAGFLSRVVAGSRAVNHVLGYVIMALGVPAAVALAAFIRGGADPMQWIGAAVFLVFVVLMVIVDYVWVVEFRSPPRNEILVPYLILFFGSILLMGLPMFWANRALWLVTAVDATLLIATMVLAMRRGVG
jgi:hypothetical protein